MATATILSELRKALVELYPDITSIRRIADDADLAIARISFVGSPVTIWHGVLQEADKQAKLDPLLAVVLGDYPRFHPLQTAYKQYLEYVKDTGQYAQNGYNTQDKDSSLSPSVTEYVVLHALNCSGMDDIKQVHKKLAKHEVVELSILDNIT